MIRKTLYSLLFLMTVLTACTPDPTFEVNGTIADAEGKTLHFEAVQIDKISSLDSIKLKKNGTFSFRQKSPDSPEFYRLRMDNRIINFSIDSTETVVINASNENFATTYSINGSENSEKIKELVLLQIDLQSKVDRLMQDARNRKIRNHVLEDSLSNLLQSYKDNVRMNYIYKAPNKAYAYFALFQQVNNYMIFDHLNNKDDVRAFAAVATSLNNSYPHSERSRSLYNMAIKGMKNTRAPQAQEVTIDIPEVEQIGIIDIDLKDIKGNSHKLSELKGKVVLLDFTIYQSAISVSHNFTLRDLYDKYADQGFEIYQVSLDNDEHFWRTAAANFPWTCVRDPNGIYSTYAATYFVEQLPSVFLINRNSELSARGDNIEDIEKEIKKLL